MKACTQNSSNVEDRYSITIWDYNYSMAYSTNYMINNDSLIINTISGVEGEKDRTVLRRSLAESEEKKLSGFLSSFPLEKLDTEYKNSLVLDGDIKKVEIVFNNKTKTILLENFYQKDMQDLFNVINQILEGDVKIKYQRSS